jgi:hypothetical protein
VPVHGMTCAERHCLRWERRPALRASERISSVAQHNMHPSDPHLGCSISCAGGELWLLSSCGIDLAWVKAIASDHYDGGVEFESIDWQCVNFR